MTQSKLITKDIANIGENIGLELGTQLVKNFQVANPTETQSFQVGRRIIEQILAQPGCVGIRIFNAIDEMGGRTLVFVGVNEAGNAILNYSVISSEGKLSKEKGIVADRIDRGSRSTGLDADNFTWDLD